MHPVLFSIGNFQLPTYGVALVVAFLTATYFIKREAGRMGLDAQKTADTAIMGLLFGLVGAKALLILIDLPHYLSNPGELLGTIRLAGVIYGGVLGGIVGIAWYVRRHNLPAWDTFDVLAPFAALGMGIGRLGCFFSGCCYGMPYEGPLAMAAEHTHCTTCTTTVFPVQIVGLLNGVALCLVLVAILRKRKFEGQVLLSFGILYGLTRGLIEFLRGDDVERGMWLAGYISTSQIVAILFIVVSVFLYIKKNKEATT